MQMVEDEILSAIPDSAAEKALKKIKSKGSISLQEAIPLLLRGQYNHIRHLDQKIEEMATKDDIKNMAKVEDVKKNEEKIKDIIARMATKDDIRTLKWIIGIGLGALSLLITFLSIFIK